MDIEPRTPPSERVDESVFRCMLVADQWAGGLSITDRLDFYRWLGVSAVDKHNEILDAATLAGTVTR